MATRATRAGAVALVMAAVVPLATPSATAGAPAGAATGAGATPVVTVGARYATSTSTVVSWKAGSAGRFDVAYRVAGYRHAFSPVRTPARWQHTTATTATIALAPGHTYCFRARADDGGRVSPWSAYRCTSTPVRARLVSAHRGATVSFPRARMDHLAVVAERCPRCGRVGAWVNGAYAGSVDLTGPAAPAAVVPFGSTPYRDGTLVLKVLSRHHPVTVTGVVPARFHVPADAWVRVNVGSIWMSPQAPRRVDRPALANPPRLSRWLASLTTARRFGLHGHIESQALLGTHVRLVGHQGHWSRVEVPSQFGSFFHGGLIGWMPTRQLTRHTPPVTRRLATVVSRVAPTYRRTHGRRVEATRISYGTALHVLSSTRHWVKVAMPAGGTRVMRKSDVVVHGRSTAPLHGRGRALVTQARIFRGLPFLWAGMSGFGIDCAGLTSMLYAQFGVALPLDAADQAARGKRVDPHHLRPGDLLFFSIDGTRVGIHHVAIYVGHGRIIDSPYTGGRVGVRLLGGAGKSVTWWGARRYF